MKGMYKDLCTRLLRSDQMKNSLDIVTKQQIPVLNAILMDFKILTEISLWSDKCSPDDLEQFEKKIVRIKN